MMLALLLAAIVPTSPDEISSPSGKPETLKINILVEQPQPECEPSEGDEIVVCAEPEDNERYRLRPIPDAEQFEKDESKAEFGIGDGAVMAVETESAALGGGVTSPRLMIRIKVPF
jgi:hypothetical protein